MSNMLKPFLICLSVLTVAASAMWLVERRESDALARQLSAAESELASLEAVKKGLEEANQQLHSQVKTLRDAPPLFTVVESSSNDLNMSDGFEDEPAPERRSRSARETTQEPEAELTPEQIAEREEREARRQEWREERERRREEFRTRMTEELQVRKAFFAQVPTEGLAPEYKQAHAQLMANLDKIQGLMNQMGDPELDRDQRREVMREMFETSREVEGLMVMQRDVLLNDYAQSIGLGAEQTRDFIDYMQAVNEMTSPASMGGGRGR